MKKIFAIIILLYASVVSLYAQEGIIGGGLEGVQVSRNLIEHAEAWIDTIDALASAVQGSGLYKTLIDGNSISFPYAVVPKNGNERLALIVKDVKFDAVLGLQATICMKIPLRSDKYLYFAADQVPLSRDGQITGDMKLMLLKRETLNFGEGYALSFGPENIGSAYDSTFVTFDCNGFKNITINGALKFSENNVLHYYEDTAGVHRVPLVVPFYFQAEDLEQVILELHDVPDFQFTKLLGFKCSMPYLLVDMSMTRNSPGFTLPQNYLDILDERIEDFDEEVYLGDSWEGVYIPSIVVQLPKKFKADQKVLNMKDSVARDSILSQSEGIIIGQNIIVDQFGVTAKANGSNLLRDSIKGFDFTIDSLHFEMVTSTLNGAGFMGDMVLPISKKETPLQYNVAIAGVEGGGIEFHGSVQADSGYAISSSSFGRAKLNLTQVQLEFGSGKSSIDPRVELDGSMSMSPKNDSDTSRVANIGVRFAGLRLQTVEPYIDLASDGYLGIDKSKKNNISKLPVSIDSLQFVKKSNSVVGFAMAVTVHLQGKGDAEKDGGSFTGSTAFNIWAEQRNGGGKWQYKNFELNSVSLSVDNGSFSLEGSISKFNNDTIYGTGFCGYLKVNVVHKISLQAGVMFGEKSNVKYWFADMAADFPGLPLFPGINLNYFSGGLYHHMEIQKDGAQNPSTLNCKTATGRKFVPNESIHLGLIAGIGIASTGSGTGFNGKINFGLEFNNTGGLNRIATWGEVAFIDKNYTPPKFADELDNVKTKAPDENTKAEQEQSEPTKQGGKQTNALSAMWYVEYDFPAQTLSGTFDIYVDFGDALQGAGPKKKAGRISIYSDPSNWYVYVGRPVPGEMVGVKVKDIVTLNAYLCLGTVLPTPPMAAIPDEVRIGEPIDYSGIMAMGGGFSFGARLQVKGKKGVPLWDDYFLGIKYAILAGFDVLLMKTHQPVYCMGSEIERGVNNWYATGQAYIYGEASLCVENQKRSWDLVGAYLKAFVFVQAPNPTYLLGAVQVGFRFLGKDRNKSFDLEIGEQCELTEEVDLSVDFIATVTPSSGQDSLPVTTTMAVLFNNSLNNFHYTVKDSKDNPMTYRNVLYGEDESGVVLESNGIPLEFEWRLNDSRDQMSIVPLAVLPERSTITLSVSVITQKQSGNVWVDTELIETETITFTTGSESPTLAVSDVEYAYPLPNMQNFYKNESNRGIVKLNLQPRKPVSISNDYSWQVGIYYYNEEVARVENVSYDGAKTFTFTLPIARLDNDREYTFKLMKAPIPSIVSQNSYANGAAGGVYGEEQGDTTILEYQFRVSEYNTFVDKMSIYNTSLTEVFNGVAFANLTVHEAIRAGAAMETISDYETDGYYVDGMRTVDNLIQVGMPSTGSGRTFNSSYNLSINAGGGLSLTSDAISNINSTLSEMNLSCLLEGGCSSNDIERVTIPRGTMQLPVSYYIPGQNSPTSTFNIPINISSDIVMPRG